MLHNVVFICFISLKDLSAVAVPTGISRMMSISLNISGNIPVYRHLKFPFLLVLLVNQVPFGAMIVSLS